MVPLVDLESLSQEKVLNGRAFSKFSKKESDFGTAFKKWKQTMAQST
jgi:hypothetical protein